MLFLRLNHPFNWMTSFVHEPFTNSAFSFTWNYFPDSVIIIGHNKTPPRSLNSSPQAISIIPQKREPVSFLNRLPFQCGEWSRGGASTSIPQVRPQLTHFSIASSNLSCTAPRSLYHDSTRARAFSASSSLSAAYTS